VVGSLSSVAIDELTEFVPSQCVQFICVRLTCLIFDPSRYLNGSQIAIVQTILGLFFVVMTWFPYVLCVAE
jgi:hypothetical protein